MQLQGPSTKYGQKNRPDIPALCCVWQLRSSAEILQDKSDKKLERATIYLLGDKKGMADNPRPIPSFSKTSSPAVCYLRGCESSPFSARSACHTHTHTLRSPAQELTASTRSLSHCTPRTPLTCFRPAPATSAVYRRSIGARGRCRHGHSRTTAFTVGLALHAIM